MRVFRTLQIIEAEKIEPRVKSIVKDFIEYKSTNDPGNAFGRDAKFSRPRGIEFDDVRHVHILYGMEQKRLKILKIKTPYDRCSDSFLVYCGGYASGDYLIIDIIWDDAHKKSESIDRMQQYMKIAENFRKTH